MVDMRHQISGVVRAAISRVGPTLQQHSSLEAAFYRTYCVKKFDLMAYCKYVDRAQKISSLLRTRQGTAMNLHIWIGESDACTLLRLWYLTLVALQSMQATGSESTRDRKIDQGMGSIMIPTISNPKRTPANQRPFQTVIPREIPGPVSTFV